MGEEWYFFCHKDRKYHEIGKPEYRCGCACVDTAADGDCGRTECGVQYSTQDQVATCPIPIPPRWPDVLQLPPPESRAVRTASQPFDGLPDSTCRDTWSCPAAFLFTGGNARLPKVCMIFIMVFRINWSLL